MLHCAAAVPSPERPLRGEPTRRPRWTIARPLPLIGLLLGAVVGGVALAGGLSRKGSQPPPVEPASSAAVGAPTTPVAPPAPALFAQPLPLSLDKVPEGLASISSQACTACHGGTHSGWERSAHANAWNDADFQAAMAKVGNATACRACHLPLANQHAKLAAANHNNQVDRPELQPNPSWDPTLMREGVSCAACHVRDGLVIGPRAAPGAPHPVAASAELHSSELCATCHQLSWPEAKSAFYDTFGEWSRSAYAKSGVQCQDCHMPPKPTGSIGGRFAAEPDHSFDVPLEHGLSLYLSMPAAELQRGAPFAVSVRVLNSGAGHMIPTGSPYKVLVAHLELVGADGKVLDPGGSVRIGRTVGEAPPWDTITDNRLAPGAELTLAHSFVVPQKVAAQTATLRVRIDRELVGGTTGPQTVLTRAWPLPLL